MLNLYRRHLKKCPQRKKGRKCTGCACPIWADGELNGRGFRRSLKLRDWQRAIRKLAAIEDQGMAAKPISEAIARWQAQLDVADESRAKYARLMRFLGDYCGGHGIETMPELALEHLDAFRASRKTSRNTAGKELSTLRQFLRFCQERGWVQVNWAARIKMPKARPAEVEPYTANEVTAMLAACDAIGQSGYERLRAKALLLLLRHTALRITDAYTLRRGRVSPDGAGGWQIHLYTGKTGGHVMLPIPAGLKAALDILPVPIREDGSQVDAGYYFWTDCGTRQSAREIGWRLLKSVFEKAGVKGAKPHRFRHTLATDILARGGTMADVADVLAITETIARKHYAKWTPARQDRISTLMRGLYAGTPGVHAGDTKEKTAVVQ